LSRNEIDAVGLSLAEVSLCGGGMMKTSAARYYNADGSPSELGKAANAKIQPIVDERNKLGTITADPYIDWLVY
jgi:hypothetical protein